MRDIKMQMIGKEGEETEENGDITIREAIEKKKM
jgi:hypothetical protein